MNPVKLAKKAIEEYLKNNQKISLPQTVEERLKTDSFGVFVTIKNKGDLRGCIGTLSPTRKNLGEEIISNAIAACQDPRFRSLKAEELPNLTYEVSIIKEKKKVSPEKIKNINPKKEGIIVKSGSKTGVLLPDLEDVDTVNKQLEIALKKGGIDKKEDYKVFKFETEKYEGM